MTKQQERQQIEGPCRPQVMSLIAMLENIAQQVEVVAVSINGEAGIVVVETIHEELKTDHVFKGIG